MKKVWLFVLMFFLIFDIVAHFTMASDASAFSVHLNYVASILMAFTVGLSVADTPAFEG